MIPQEITQAWGELPHLRQVRSNEYHSACPQCGSAGHVDGPDEPDRFFIIVEGDPNRTRGVCRRCGYSAFALNEVRKSQRVRLNSDQMEQLRVSREFEEKRRVAEAEDRRLEFATSKLWDKYHANMADQERRWWERQGIPQEWQDFWNLGSTPALWDLGPAFSIPFYAADEAGVGQFDSNAVPVTLQYRLATATSDKYRFERGLGSGAYIARPDLPIRGAQVYVVEGGKKAMVTHILGTDCKIQVVGFPSKMSDGGIIPLLKQASSVHIMLDPDAWDQPPNRTENWSPWPIRYAIAIGKHARVTRLPGKIDDALLSGELDCQGLEYILRYSRSYP